MLRSPNDVPSIFLGLLSRELRVVDASEVVPNYEGSYPVIVVTVLIRFLLRSVRRLLTEDDLVPTNDLEDHVFLEANVNLDKIIILAVAPRINAARVVCRGFRGALKVILVQVVRIPYGVVRRFVNV